MNLMTPRTRLKRLPKRGALPLKLTPGEPLADPRQPRDIPVPAYAKKWPRPRGAS